MEIKARIATDEDKATMPAFDFTKLSALNTCPRWGLVRYDQHKRMPGESRSMALDLGSTAHYCFAAIRYGQLLTYGDTYYGKSFDRQQVVDYGRSALGPDRFDKIFDGFDAHEDRRRAFVHIGLVAANLSGFYDDPDDKRRTLCNLETSLIAYIDRQELERNIPLIGEDTEGRLLIGIEVPFDIALPDLGIRYIGRVDGLVYDRMYNNKIKCEENKTATRLNDAWYDSFVMSHQVTGYCVAMTTMLGELVDECVVRGMMVPLPKTYDNGGIADNPVSRDMGRFTQWYRWVTHTVEDIWRPWKDRFLEAPEYTHSCNRYFRSCSFIPLCSVTGEEREQTFNEMVHDEWNPLETENE